MAESKTNVAEVPFAHGDSVRLKSIPVISGVVIRITELAGGMVNVTVLGRDGSEYNNYQEDWEPIDGPESLRLRALANRIVFLEEALQSVTGTYQIRVDPDAPAWLEHNQETGSLMIDSSPCIAPYLAWLNEPKEYL